ncbi:MAG TPA: hypothetical protein PK156_41835 [Polyangium sp.]|nr:hypothetical protein [Polyangium sp.]
MSADAVQAASPLEAKRGWLHSRGIDLVILVGPWFFLAITAALELGTPKGVWISQFIFGNTTHVILTFLLLATRRDILRATPTQAQTVLIGSTITLLLSYGVFVAVNAAAPYWIDFPVAILAIFGIHHRLSQARGIWSLYNMAGSNMGPPSAAERSLYGLWTPIGLLLVCIDWLFVPIGPGRFSSATHPIPQMEAPLPYETAYLLAGIWLLFSGFLVRALWKGGARLPKLLHVGTHIGAVCLALLSPIWGSIVWGAIHGLEYYFLCARMMQPRTGDEQPGISRYLVWPLIIASMAPIFLIGLARSPFAPEMTSPYVLHAVFLTNAIVIAHYFADAFIYRFRIPTVRRVALHRLGFSQP